MTGTCIDGKKIAQKILDSLQLVIQKEHLKPHVEVILLGDNPASLSFIRQKQKAAETIGAVVHLTQLPGTTTQKELETLIKQGNEDKTINGIIIQRPLPPESEITHDTLHLIVPEKDIDGFVPHSHFQVPVAKAVIHILEHIFHQGFDTPTLDFVTWLRQNDLVVVGKGETAGKPICTLLESLSVPVVMIDRSTPHAHDLFRKAKIIISCAGKPHLIPPNAITEGVILISVGLSKEEGKLIGDYDVEDIQNIAGWYTPTPGGVGPVNVACLMENLVKAAQMT